MKVVITGKVLDIISKDYEYEGKKGVSHKVVVYDDGKIENIKIPIEMINHYKKLLNQKVDIECNLYLEGKYSLNISNK